MKLILISIILTFFSLFNFANANNIVFVDMDKILSDSKPGSNILKQLNILRENNVNDFDKKTKLLKEKEEEIIKQKNILSPKDFQIKVVDLKNEVNDYNKYRENKIKNYNKLKSENTNKLLGLISPILSNYTKNNSILMILQKKNIILGKVELDITKTIIELVNKNIKNFKIK